MYAVFFYTEMQYKNLRGLIFSKFYCQKTFECKKRLQLIFQIVNIKLPQFFILINSNTNKEH